MSFAFPGIERKRTSENAPITATPVPMFPLTIVITVDTIIGSKTSEARKLFFAFDFKLAEAAMISPQTNEAARHIKKLFTVIEPSSTVPKRFSIKFSPMLLLRFCFLIRFYKILRI